MPKASAGGPAAASAAAVPVPVVLALGSNRWHGRHGRPADVLRAAAAALAQGGLALTGMSAIVDTPALGPAGRRFCNAVLAGQWQGTPAALLRLAKGLERAFGRRPGRRWGPRVLDIDIIAFGNKRVAAPGLQVPHPRMADRAFVLRPMLMVAPGWRHPATGLGVRHMAARLAKARPIAAAPAG